MEVSLLNVRKVAGSKPVDAPVLAQPRRYQLEGNGNRTRVKPMTSGVKAVHHRVAPAKCTLVQDCS